MKRLTLSLLALLGSAGASSMPINYWPSAERPAYLQVPSYQRYEDVRLLLQTGTLPAGVKEVEVWLDGKAAGRQLLTPGQTTLRLPELAPGGHEVRLQTLGPVAPGECAALGRPVPLQGAELRFTSRELGQPILARLPDGLYRANPGALPIGTLRADEWNSATLGTALGLAQVLTGRNQLLWQAGGAQDLPADFTVNLKRRPDLRGPVRLELQPGRLNVLYRKDTELAGAVSALALPQLRETLLDATADLDTVVPLPRPRLVAPRTLRDFGLADYRVWSGHEVMQAIRLPPLWEPGGPVTGKLEYHLPLPFSGREKVTLKVGRHVLDASPSAATRYGRDSVVTPFRGDTLGPTDGLSLGLAAGGLSNTCQAALRVDMNSSVDFRARTRTGLAALPRTLAYSPVVQIDRSPEAIALALNVAASLQAWGLQGPLPWQARFAGDAAAAHTPATLTIRTDSGAQVDGARLQATQTPLVKSQVTITARGAADLNELAQSWSRVPAQLTNDLRLTEVRPGGEVVNGPALAYAQAELPSGGERWALLFSLLALPVAGLLWQRQDRDRP